jgi:Flp pilus assembly protein TadG
MRLLPFNSNGFEGDFIEQLKPGRTPMYGRRIHKTESGRGVCARRREHGNSTLEMVLVLPVLLSMAFGLVEFGQYLYVKHCFESAARDAARVAVLSTATQSQMTSVLSSTLAQANVTYSSSWLTITDLGPSGSGTVSNIANVAAGDEMQFTLSTNYSAIPNVVRPLSSFTGIGVKSTTNVVGMCTMVKE